VQKAAENGPAGAVARLVVQLGCAAGWAAALAAGCDR
jgi:hypothetical protein